MIPRALSDQGPWDFIPPMISNTARSNVPVKITTSNLHDNLMVMVVLKVGQEESYDLIHTSYKTNNVIRLALSLMQT